MQLPFSCDEKNPSRNQNYLNSMVFIYTRKKKLPNGFNKIEILLIIYLYLPLPPIRMDTKNSKSSKLIKAN